MWLFAAIALAAPIELKSWNGIEARIDIALPDGATRGECEFCAGTWKLPGDAGTVSFYLSSSSSSSAAAWAQSDVASWKESDRPGTLVSVTEVDPSTVVVRWDNQGQGFGPEHSVYRRAEGWTIGVMCEVEASDDKVRAALEGACRTMTVAP